MTEINMEVVEKSAAEEIADELREQAERFSDPTNELMRDAAEALTSAQAEIERLTKELNKWRLRHPNPTDVRYWEGRYRDEAAEVDRLKQAVDAFADICDELGCERDNEAGLQAAHTLKAERDSLREQMGAAMDALILARQSLEWFTERYPSDDEITAHRIHLRRVVSALQPLEPKND